MIDVYRDYRQFKAMGCHMAAWLYADEQFATEPLNYVEQYFKEEEKRLTRFDPSSELMQLNSRPGEWVHVSAELWELVQTGLELKQETNGRFDCTLLQQLELSGYAQSFERIEHHSPQSPHAHPPNHAHRPKILFHPDQKLIQLGEGTKIDLGGIAKGYTAQSCRDFLHTFGPCLIDAGGDLTAGDGPGVWPGWPVAIQAPWGQAHEIGRVWLQHATLATSGIDYRRWKNGDVRAHHIIDPRTGTPADTDLITVSVLHADACTAEAWATATLVAGRDVGLSILEERNIAAVLIDADEAVHVTTHMRPELQR